MRAISLFSGAGGMDIGAKGANFETLLASELDKHACRTFRHNFPKCKLIEGDIDEHLDEICKLEGIDLVYGGPPCQGFSVAGKMDPNDPRSKLVFSFLSVVEKVKPKAFVMENVRALGALSKFEDVRAEIIRRAHKAGYDTRIHILNSKDFGVPQSRERVFFIGTQNGLRPIEAEAFSQFHKPAPSLRDAIGHLGPAGSQGNPHVTKAKITLAAKPVMRKSPYSGMLFNGQGRPLNPDSWSSTLPASMGGNRTPIIDEDHLYKNKPGWVEEYHSSLVSGEALPVFGDAPSHLRRMTITEAAIIQTFPNDFVFLGPQSRVFSQIGNAVPCMFAEAVLSTVALSILGLPSGTVRSAHDKQTDLFKAA